MKVEDVTGDGKYYETRLELTFTDGRVVFVQLSSDDYEPSARALRGWDSREEFDRECCDGHYEREVTRLVADAILDGDLHLQ